MKSTIKKDADPNATRKYPVLMENIGSLAGAVVLFNNRNSGTLLYDPTGKSDLFQHSRCWVEADDRSEWKVFRGEITLSN